MACKLFVLADLGEVSIYKRKGSKKISLKVVAGNIRVTQPTWLPYGAGLSFAKQNSAWVMRQLSQEPIFLLENGLSIGKQHTLSFINAEKLRTYVKNGFIEVHAPHQQFSHPSTQTAAKRAIKRALAKETTQLIPARLSLLASTYDYQYQAMQVKPMKTRWGSCSSGKIITINSYLLLMPWEVIDYVLLHELTHTKHLHHGKDFWDALATFMPDYKQRKNMLKELQKDVAKVQI